MNRIFARLFVILLILCFVTASVYARKPVKLSNAQMKKVQGAVVAGFLPYYTDIFVPVMPIIPPVSENATNISNSSLQDKNSKDTLTGVSAALLGVAGTMTMYVNPTIAAMYFAGARLDTELAGAKYTESRPENEQKCIYANEMASIAMSGGDEGRGGGWVYFFIGKKENLDLIGNENCTEPYANYIKAKGEAVPSAMIDNSPTLVGGVAGELVGEGLSGTKIANSPLLNTGAKQGIKIISGDVAKQTAKSIVEGNSSIVYGTKDKLVCEYTDPTKAAAKLADILFPAIGSQLSDDFRNGVPFANRALLEYGDQKSYYDLFKQTNDFVNWGNDKIKENQGSIVNNNDQDQNMCIIPKELRTYFGNSGDSNDNESRIDFQPNDPPPLPPPPVTPPSPPVQNQPSLGSIDSQIADLTRIRDTLAKNSPQTADTIIKMYNQQIDNLKAGANKASSNVSSPPANAYVSNSSSGGGSSRSSSSGSSGGSSGGGSNSSAARSGGSSGTSSSVNASPPSASSGSVGRASSSTASEISSAARSGNISNLSPTARAVLSNR